MKDIIQTTLTMHNTYVYVYEREILVSYLGYNI